ncbi:Choline/ethanolamine kinase [Halotydeus destructor]|nr:Choline/ethanolamine kinase [Halotydeus destructor]
MASQAEPSAENADRAKQLCAQFLAGSWRQADNIQTSSITGGYMNTIIKCSLKEASRDEQLVPHTVVVRFYRDPLIPKNGGEVGEALAVHMINSAGLGPKLIGVFEGGRIEEFIDGKNISPMLFRDKNGLTALAECVASFHSIDFPLPIVNTDVCETGKRIVNGQKNRHDLDIKLFSPRAQEALEFLLNYDAYAEYKWLLAMAEKIPSRTVFCHNDLYMNNIMIKNSAKQDSITKDDLAIIDAELLQYTFRGLDTSLLLNEAAYDWSDTKCPKLLGHLDEELEEFFLEKYINKWKELKPELYDPNVDNVSNMMLEQRLWSLRVAPWFCAVWMIPTLIEDKNAFSEDMIVGLRDRFEADKQRKVWVVKKLDQLGF